MREEAEKTVLPEGRILESLLTLPLQESLSSPPALLSVAECGCGFLRVECGKGRWEEAWTSSYTGDTCTHCLGQVIKTDAVSRKSGWGHEHLPWCRENSAHTVLKSQFLSFVRLGFCHSLASLSPHLRSNCFQFFSVELGFSVITTICK